MKKKKMLCGAALVAAFSFGCKGLGMLFRLYLASRMGAEGIGLYQLVMSVYALFTSLGSAGFTVCVSRLAAEDAELCGVCKAAGTARSSMRAALLVGSFSALLLLALSYPVSQMISGGGKTLASFRILAFSMPFIALSSCLKGFFLAMRKAAVPASSQLFEELCKISVTVAVLTFVLGRVTDNGALCAGIAFGLTAGEILSFCYLRLFFFAGTKRAGKPSGGRAASEILPVLLPLACGNWLTSALHAAENVLVPFCFSLYSGDGAALAEFGVIRGMAIPVLFFPFAFVSSFISMLTPEISRLNVADIPARNAAVGRVLRLTSVISVAAGALMFFFASEISVCFYRTEQAVHSIKTLSLVTPFMYLETVSDGVLKSIGEQTFCMRVTVANCALRVAAVFAFIPRTGAEGYLLLLVVSNTFSCFMCVFKLMRICRVRGFFTHFVYPACCAAASGAAAQYLLPSLPAMTRLGAGTAFALALFAFASAPLLYKNGNRKPV